jgi:hypothetical protein
MIYTVSASARTAIGLFLKMEILLETRDPLIVLCSHRHAH